MQEPDYKLDEMVNRFLTWPLPDSVCPDKATTDPNRHSGKYRPLTGTNILTAVEAKAMLKHVLADQAALLEAQEGRECPECSPDGVFATDGSGPYDCYKCGKPAKTPEPAGLGGVGFDKWWNSRDPKTGNYSIFSDDCSRSLALEGWNAALAPSHPAQDSPTEAVAVALARSRFEAQKYSNAPAWGELAPETQQFWIDHAIRNPLPAKNLHGKVAQTFYRAIQLLQHAGAIAEAETLASIRDTHAAPAGDAELRSKLGNLLGCGSLARSDSILLTNVRNLQSFSDKLAAIEREFFMVPGERDEDYPDDKPEDECVLNRWGATTAEYVEQFRAALSERRGGVALPADQQRKLQPTHRELRTAEEIQAAFDAGERVEYLIGLSTLSNAKWIEAPADTSSSMRASYLRLGDRYRAVVGDGREGGGA